MITRSFAFAFALSMFACHCEREVPTVQPHDRQPGPPAASASDVSAEELRMPEGSADYSAVLADVLLYRHGKISFSELQDRIVARKLPPHPLGCQYTMDPVPMPPPGTKFNPAIMPPDWKGTFGEVAMTYWAGKLSLEDYNKLHKAAHGH